MADLDLQITRKQKQFIDATAMEVLYGGAAGGGKSYCQLIDALRVAIDYPKSTQLIMRRTYPELERSLIRVALQLFPKRIYRYNDSKKLMSFANGSIVEFGYCASERDVIQYQSAEYDVIRIDELTHYTEFMYTYLISRLRGANNYPKQMKSSTNPGGVGHSWVKGRFIDPAPPGEQWEAEHGSRVYLPAKVTDNVFLMEKDPGYLARLENLPERERKALLDGDWNVYEGQFFGEFSLEIHTCGAFEIPKHWRRYRAMDYGLDMLAVLWIAVDEQRRAYVYKELYQSGLIISDAAAQIHELNDGDVVEKTLGPPDMWNRRQESGRTAYDIFAEHGIYLSRASNDRVAGWLAVKEWLRPHVGEDGEPVADLTIFENCRNLIRTLPMLQASDKNPNDVAGEPHELTHAPDALRAFCVGWTAASEPPEQPRDPYEPAVFEMQVEDFINF